MEQLPLLKDTRKFYHNVRKNTSGTFVNNMKLPIHRWFRYSAGFSADWVTQEIYSYQNERGIYPKFGQIIGNLLEAIIYPLLLKYCNKNNLLFVL